MRRKREFFPGSIELLGPIGLFGLVRSSMKSGLVAAKLLHRAIPGRRADGSGFRGLGRRWLGRNRRLYARGRSWRRRSAGIATIGDCDWLRAEDQPALDRALRRRWRGRNRWLCARGRSGRRRSAGITAIDDCAWLRPEDLRPEDQSALDRPTGRAMEHTIGKSGHGLMRHHCRHDHRLAARHATHQTSSRTQVPQFCPAYAAGPEISNCSAATVNDFWDPFIPDRRRFRLAMHLPMSAGRLWCDEAAIL